jgi:phosphoenolpyruvate carboxylase
MSNSEAKSSIYDALLKQKVELILTAHPIKVNRIPR